MKTKIDLQTVVNLTVNLRGANKNLSRNGFRDSEHKEIQDAELHDCKKTVQLGKEFVSFSTSFKSRPSAHRNSIVRTQWGSMNKVQRLKYHIGALARSMNASSYEFEII